MRMPSSKIESALAKVAAKREGVLAARVLCGPAPGLRRVVKTQPLHGSALVPGPAQGGAAAAAAGGATGVPLLDSLVGLSSGAAGLSASTVLLYASAATGAYALWEQLRFRIAR